MTTISYTLPAYWASYLINGDASGLEDGEQATIDAYLAKEGNPLFADCGESYFAWSNDATTLGGDVCDYTALVKEKPVTPMPDTEKAALRESIQSWARTRGNQTGSPFRY